jgi:hypothetical protein
VGYRNKIAEPETGYVDPICDNAAPRSALSSIFFYRSDDRAAAEAELENVVLRHQIAVLRRQVKRPVYRASDRAFLAAASRLLRREAWSAFLVRPETLLRWHLQLVARKWTRPHRPPGRPAGFLILDRDTKFTAPFEEVFRSAGTRIVLTPIRAPNANAFCERWVGTVRAECLDWTLIYGRRHLERVLGTYIEHYNQARPHRGLDLRTPIGRSPTPVSDVRAASVQRRDILGGLIHEYRTAA